MAGVSGECPVLRQRAPQPSMAAASAGRPAQGSARSGASSGLAPRCSAPPGNCHLGTYWRATNRAFFFFFGRDEKGAVQGRALSSA
eukprot:12492110-Alexandrium_andersonii.AAC.1